MRIDKSAASVANWSIDCLNKQGGILVADLLDHLASDGLQPGRVSPDRFALRFHNFLLHSRSLLLGPFDNLLDEREATVRIVIRPLANVLQDLFAPRFSDRFLEL